MIPRHPVFSLRGALDRGRFAAAVLLLGGFCVTLALITLDFETAGGATRYSTPIAVGLMGLALLSILVLSFRRVRDFGVSPWLAILGVVASVMMPAVATLILTLLPGSARPDEGPGALAPITPWRVWIALPVGVAIAFATAAFVRALAL